MTKAKVTKKATVVPAINGLPKLRKSTGLTQAMFWNRVCCTQSAGSRYETGRKVPKPVALLLTIAYGNPKELKIALDRLRPLDK